MASDDPKILFGKGIRALREARGLTQSQLAEKADLDSWKYIGTVENARTNITLTNLLKLAQGLDLSQAKMMNACFPQDCDRRDLLAELIQLVADEDDATVRMLMGMLNEAKKWREATRR